MGFGGRGSYGPEGRDGAEQLAAVADRPDAETNQVFGRQIRRHNLIDIIFLKTPAQPFVAA
jgi:hypothetical protein